MYRINNTKQSAYLLHCTDNMVSQHDDIAQIMLADPVVSEYMTKSQFIWCIECTLTWLAKVVFFRSSLISTPNHIDIIPFSLLALL